MGPEPFCGVSKCVIQMELKKWEENMIQENWTATKTLRQSKLFITPNRQKTNRILSLNKSSLSILTGLFTGHCPVKYHLRKLKRCDTDICRFCDYEIETSE